MENRNDGKRGCGFEVSATATGLEDGGKRESLGLCVGLIIKHAAFLSTQAGPRKPGTGMPKICRVWRAILVSAYESGSELCSEL
jgi:hypothetical protein